MLIIQESGPHPPAGESPTTEIRLSLSQVTKVSYPEFPQLLYAISLDVRSKQCLSSEVMNLLGSDISHYNLINSNFNQTPSEALSPNPIAPNLTLAELQNLLLQ